MHPSPAKPRSLSPTNDRLPFRSPGVFLPEHVRRLRPTDSDLPCQKVCNGRPDLKERYPGRCSENLPPRNFSAGYSWNFRRRWGFNRLDTFVPPSASSTIVCGRLERFFYVSPARRERQNDSTLSTSRESSSALVYAAPTQKFRRLSVLTSERAGPEQVQRGEGVGPRGETKDSVNTLIIKVIPT